ncbi:hypothetical protein ABVT39_002010 [Epinephelus coioides]
MLHSYRTGGTLPIPLQIDTLPITGVDEVVYDVPDVDLEGVDEVVHDVPDVDLESEDMPSFLDVDQVVCKDELVNKKAAIVYHDNLQMLATFLQLPIQNCPAEGCQGKPPFQGGDFMLATNILLSGNNYAKIALLFKLMNMGIVANKTFLNIEDTYCVDTVNEFWLDKRAEVTDRLSTKDQVIVLGDGRIDYGIQSRASTGSGACIIPLISGIAQRALAKSYIRNKRCYNKKSQRWSVYTVKVQKDYSYIPELQQALLGKRVHSRKGLPKRRPPHRDTDARRHGLLTDKPPPPTEELVRTQIPRGQVLHISKRQKSRSLEHIERLESLETSSDASPTDPSVLKEEMKRLVTTSHALGDKYTIITGYQATYELAVAIRNKHQDEFCNVVLLLGGFHQAHNYMKAICKIIRDAGAKDLLVATGLCQEGTAKKFGEKADYYQTVHALKILSEAMWHLFWEAFETSAADKVTQHWKPQVESVLKILFEKDITSAQKLEMIQMTHPQISVLREQLLLFHESINGQPTAVLWSTFLEMSDVLHRFIYYEREGDWTGNLCESARMLHYFTAAGHHRYGQQSLPLYLAEIKKLPDTAPEVHEALMAGVFVGRQADGNHNSASLDMLLEQMPRRGVVKMAIHSALLPGRSGSTQNHSLQLSLQSSSLCSTSIPPAHTMSLVRVVQPGMQRW